MSSGTGSGPVRLGVVGCGAVARWRHLPALRRVEEIEVVAVADPDPARGADVAERFGVPRRYTDAQRLVEDPDVEAVAVCVPPAAHVEVALAALDAGKHVLVEKPLAASLEDAERLAERAERSSADVVVGFNLRWHRLLRRAREVVRRGDLGSVHCVRTLFSDPLATLPDLPAWRGRREEGGGALFDRAVHHFDLWRFLLADEVEEVFAFSRSETRDDDAAVVTARLRSGALAVTAVLDNTAVRQEVAVFGERGALDVDCYRFDGLRRSSLADLPGTPATRVRRLREALADPRGSAAAIRRGGDFDATYEAEWRHFAAVVRRAEPPACTLADGRAALEIALAAAGSASTGEPVRPGAAVAEEVAS